MPWFIMESSIRVQLIVRPFSFDKLAVKIRSLLDGAI